MQQGLSCMSTDGAPGHQAWQGQAGGGHSMWLVLMSVGRVTRQHARMSIAGTACACLPCDAQWLHACLQLMQQPIFSACLHACACACCWRCCVCWFLTLAAGRHA